MTILPRTSASNFDIHHSLVGHHIYSKIIENTIKINKVSLDNIIYNK